MNPSGEGEPPVSAAGDSDGLGAGIDGLFHGVTRVTTYGERLLWAAVLGLIVLDLGTTAYGLQVGFSESNPIASALLSDYGFWALVALKGGSVAVAVVGWVVLPAAYRYLSPLLLAAPWAIGSALNLLLFAGLTSL